MLLVALTAMIGSIYLFCTTDRDRDHDELRDKEMINDKLVQNSFIALCCIIYARLFRNFCILQLGES